MGTTTILKGSEKGTGGSNFTSRGQRLFSERAFFKIWGQPLYYIGFLVRPAFLGFNPLFNNPSNISMKLMLPNGLPVLVALLISSSEPSLSTNPLYFSLSS